LGTLDSDDPVEMKFDGDHVNSGRADVAKNVEEFAANCKSRVVGIFLFGAVVDTDADVGGIFVVIGRNLFLLDEIIVLVPLLMPRTP
jgi:hypothetical protein